MWNSRDGEKVIVVRFILPKKETSKARLKEEGVMWIFGERLFQAKGIGHAKALR